ncbi:hypothetical protein BDV23DRAFT_170597 [Aspergillus alliaceus]|uniref:Zn(2)-C6 fungal-type domain-containing protein n=2 Tax=Petromyces alliaceus TaxID=209559 RepID=A0A5N7CFK7_PETAA|nr:hypothetical protein BDV23DRAFT_170597 [Aspergillus alliaceus]
MFRRNGKPVSCEPCRVSKIRCDHHRPTCKRCQARRMESQCFYHPAPLTRVRTNARTRPKPSRKRNNTSRPRSPSHEVIPEQSPATSNDENPHQHPGYLGSTSFASVFPVPELLFSADSAAVPTLSLPLDFCSIRVSYIHSHLLNLLSSPSEYRSLVIRYYGCGLFLIIPPGLILDPLSKTQSYLERWKNSTGGAEEKTLFEELTRNSCKRLQTSTVNTTVEEFCGSFSGPSLRWEFVGIIFALSGLASAYPEAGKPYKSGDFAMEMFAASKICMEICEQYNQLNDLTIWLRYVTVVLASNLFGDTSNIVYRCFSELVSQAFAMGLHRQSSQQDGIPFFLSETRKRMFAAIFTRDKNLATYLGRPPLVDSYFCDLMLPLDLDDDEIICPTSMRQSLVHNLDSDGWNTNYPTTVKPLRPVTGIRLRCCMAIIREKVLRLSLGNATTDDKTHLPDIFEQYKKAWAAIPQHYHYDTDCWKRLDHHSCVIRLVVYLDYCYTGYQLHRILLRQNEGSRAAFLETAMKLLSAMTDFARRQAQTVALQGRYMWVFLFYGLPGAGSLVSELHRCNTAGTPFPATVSRPKIIRELSVLVSWLENSIVPNKPEYRTCLVINALISKLLDDALLPPDAQVPPTEHEETHTDPSAQSSRLSKNAAVSCTVDNSEPQLSQVAAPPQSQSLNTGFNVSCDSVDAGFFSQEFSGFLSCEEFPNWLDGISWDGQPLGEGWPLFSER